MRGPTIASLVMMGALLGAECQGQPVQRFIRRTFGLMPMEITIAPEVKTLGGSERLGYLHGVIQHTPGAGPQALEGYTLVDHAHGKIDIAIGTIGNVEVSGSGSVGDVRSLQGGGVVTGPATVERWSALTLVQPRSAAGYDGPVNVKETNYILFDNGWSIRPEGDRLLMCRPSGTCRDF